MRSDHTAARRPAAPDPVRAWRREQLALDGVPIDVFAERLGTTRGALYKTLHDARRRLRAELSSRGFELGADGGGRRS